MRRILVTLICSSLLTAFSALAQDESPSSDQSSFEQQEATTTSNQTYIVGDENSSAAKHQQAGSSAEQALPATSVATEQPPTTRSLTDETFAVKPQVGDVNFRDASNAISNRAIYGFTMEWNLANNLNEELGTPGRSSGLYVGPQTGFFFSHIGAVGGNFFGSNSGGPESSIGNSDPGANMFYFPVDLKGGYTMGSFRLSVHGGGNFIYRSNSQAFLVGVNAPQSPNSKWGILPNAGADLEYNIVNGVAAIVRPDWTFGGSNRMFTGTVGLTFPLA